MVTGQQQLDNDLQALGTEVASIAAGVAALIQSKSTTVDLTPEDQQVQDALSRLQDIGNALQGQPPTGGTTVPASTAPGPEAVTTVPAPTGDVNPNDPGGAPPATSM